MRFVLMLAYFEEDLRKWGFTLEVGGWMLSGSWDNSMII